MSVSLNRYVKVTYSVQSTDMAAAGVAIARGQSIGNPTLTSKDETSQLIQNHCARVYHQKNGLLDVYYPKKNFGREGMNYLMSVLMGGQCDIDLIEKCRLMEADFTALKARLHGPQYGINGIRKKLGVYGRPLLAGIIKPKIGLTPQKLADICKQMADGGVDFIKEDEILADQEWCSMHNRIPLVAKALKGYKVLYNVCITGDGSEIVKKAKLAKELGAGAVHLNIWCGLGSYREVRERVDIPLFFQKSGDKVWTTGPYSIDFKVICQMANLIGCDFAHVGMWGGYMAEPISDLKARIQALNDTIPSFSCGVTPEIAHRIREQFGDNIMITSGGYMCSHLKGITAAGKEFKEALK